MPTTSEPSRVYGYVSLVDPESGRHHLLLNYDYDPPTTSIALYWLTFVFQRTTDAEQTYEVRVQSGFRAVGDPPKAFLYDVGMRQDRAASGYPFCVFAAGANDIFYNPDVWRFDRVVPGNFQGRVKVVDASGAVSYETVVVPLTQRATPFDDPELAPIA